MAGLNINTEYSKRRLAFMLNRLATGRASTEELASLTRCAKDAATFYIDHLVSQRSVKCVQTGRPRGKAKRPAIWELVPGAAVPPMPAGDFAAPTWAKHAFNARKVTITTSWPAIAIPKQSIFAALGL